MAGEEAVILANCRLLASKLGLVLSRNNCGALKDSFGRFVKFGVFSPGGADLIGWQSKVITPDLVGKSVAQFVAIECKSKNGILSEEQTRFLKAVTEAGGLAGVVRRDEDLYRITGLLK